jgi:hypothetical protein
VLFATLLKRALRALAVLEAILPAVVRAFAEGDAPLVAARSRASTFLLRFHISLKLVVLLVLNLHSDAVLPTFLVLGPSLVRLLDVVKLLLISFMPASAACSSASRLSSLMVLLATLPAVIFALTTVAVVAAAILRDFLNRRFQLLLALAARVVLALDCFALAALLLCEARRVCVVCELILVVPV